VAIYMATTTPQQNRYKNTLFDITELLYLIFCFTAYTVTFRDRQDAKYIQSGERYQWSVHSSQKLSPILDKQAVCRYRKAV
jgi:hypothetical protein